MTKKKSNCRQLEGRESRKVSEEREMLSHTVRKLHGSNDESDPETRAAMVMVGAFFVGPNIDRLIELTGYPHRYVNQIASRLKASGLWKEATLDYDFGNDARSGSVAFAVDLLIAIGVCIRGTKTADGQYQFKRVDPEPIP